MPIDGRTEFMQRAIALAVDNVSSNRGGPFGAVIVRDGQVLSEASNLVTSTNDPTAHAEIVALRRACATLNVFSLRGCVLYTSCQPCPMCLAAAYWARVEAIFYGSTAEDAASAGFDDAHLYEEFQRTPSQRSLPAVNLLRESAAAAFAAWREQAARIEY